MNLSESRGLTSRQAWTLNHITRCPLCGAWECLTNYEALTRAAPGYEVPAFCSHLTPATTRKAVA